MTTKRAARYTGRRAHPFADRWSVRPTWCLEEVDAERDRDRPRGAETGVFAGEVNPACFGEHFLLASVEADTAAEVIRNWENIKATERADPAVASPDAGNERTGEEYFLFDEGHTARILNPDEVVTLFEGKYVPDGESKSRPAAGGQGRLDARCRR